MRAADLNPPERRLLRRAARVDPNPTKLDPRDEPYADTLLTHGFVAREPMFGGRHKGIRITRLGRSALDR